MPDAARAVSGISRANPGGRVTPRFSHHLIRFRHFRSGSHALASLDRACRNLVPTFPQRSPPRHLTAAACGGLGSAPDCRTRRACLHLSYSYAPPFGPAFTRVTRHKAAIRPGIELQAPGVQPRTLHPLESAPFSRRTPELQGPL